MGVDCNNCKNKGKCGTSIVIDLIRTGGKDAFVACKSYAPKFLSVKCPNCDCIIHVDTTSKPQTNGDRIRSMTDEELADWLGVYCNGQTAQEEGKPCVTDMDSCEECWLDWLKQEATE